MNSLQTYWQTLLFVRANLFRAICIFCLLSLSACQKRTNTYMPSADMTLFQQNHWSVKARVAIKTPEESVSATLDWKKQASDFDFHIYGMFGATYAHLIQQQHQATLKLPEDQVFYHQDAEQLLYQALGWDFPIEALSYWIKGLPSGKSGEMISRDENENLSEVSLNQWTVTFSRYQSYAGYQMPRMIKASHPQLSLKVVVKDWEFLPPIN